MRKRLLSGLLAVLPLAALPAQDARAELQRAIVVDEQEHDLGKAEAMYQKLLDGNALGEAERGEVALRLGKVLQRLGKSEQATAMLQRAAKSGGDVGKEAQKALAVQGQDGEREKQLRAQARELIDKVWSERSRLLTKTRRYGVWGLQDEEIARNLLWLGDAVVPEVIAQLEAIAATFGEQGFSRDVSMLDGGGDLVAKGILARGLLGLLWKYGGKQAQQFLASIASNESIGLRVACVEAAAYLERSDMLPTLYLFLRDPAPGAPVQSALLLGDSGEVRNRIPTAELLGAAKTGANAVKTIILRYLARYWDSANHTESKAATTEQALPLMREALASTDPELGRSGQEFLFSKAMLESPGGIELLLRECPKLSPSDQVPGQLPEVKAEDAEQLLPLVLEAARALGPVTERAVGRVPRRQAWLGSAAQKILEHAEDAALPQVLELIDLGYDIPARGSLGYWLQGPENGPCRFTAKQSEQVLARLDRVADGRAVLMALAKLDLPTTMWPLLKARAETRADKALLEPFMIAIGHTGAPEAADWLLAQVSQNPDFAVTAAGALIELGKRTQAESVRAAMRTLLRAKTPLANVYFRALLFLALANMGDMGMFEPDAGIAFRSFLLQDVRQHPYATTKSKISPIRYLLEEPRDPPCGYTRQQVVEAVRSIGRQEPAFFADLSPQLAIASIPSEVLCEVGSQVLTGRPQNLDDLMPRFWLQAITQRITGSDEAGAATMREWAEQCLADKDRAIRFGILDNLQPAAVPLLRTAIEARLLDEDADCAVRAAQLLLASGVADDAAWLQRLLQNPTAGVRRDAINQLATKLGAKAVELVVPALRDAAAEVRRSACNYFAAVLDQGAVPDLLVCLRDQDEEVRKAAAEALQKIRFYHEQQAHWDRILHGVDASITNATEKLLAQGKPAQPREQRLLAIQSLADLGAPEALPFLIDWMNDKDADIAAAARSAITAIHQRAGAK